MDYGHHVAYLLYYQKSPKAPEDAICGVKYVKTYNQTLWNGGIALLEFICPQLAYCQGLMKVSRQQFKDKGKACDPGPSHTASKWNSLVLSSIRYTVAATAETVTSEDFSEAINMVSNDNDLDNDIVNTTAWPAAPPSPLPSPALSLSPPPPSLMSAASSKMTNTIDLSWIEVTPTYDGLLAYLNAQEITESHLNAILNEIIHQVRQVIINFGQNRLFWHGIPDVNTSALLWTMLNTDMLMVDEDNDNCQWRHSHYKSGIENTLLTWGSVGSIGMAFQLLATGLHISACLVHVWQKADSPMGGFTAPIVAPSLLPQPSGHAGTGPTMDDDDNNDMAVDDDNINTKLHKELDTISRPDCWLILQGLRLTPPKTMKKPAFIKYMVKLTADQDAKTSSQLIADISRKAVSKSKATVSRPKPHHIMPPITQILSVFSPSSIT
ncbi:hypothetical protein BDN71DRAFT_1426885 [Pleurotus eryngii]|uniref:Uncharacterized protein n=1 Tax=Pleurotus eryngii TaxID=5323 RepID=A0A9P6DC68_PLEER|nr:hypothetical protein BDN71DRAFT_1426885 [Pleurotus eryngii]